MTAAATLGLASLKATKNGIIGNPLRKTALARDGLIPLIVEHINPASQNTSESNYEESRTEAAHVVSSLSYGSTEALQALLTSRLHKALLYALSNTQKTEQYTLVAALTRAFKSFSTSLADIVGPPLWGLHGEKLEIKADAVTALEEIFQVTSMDVWLPYLVSNHVQISVSVAWVIASCVRTACHRDAVTQWLPPSDRAKETKGKRGWERPDVGKSNVPGRGGGWLVRNLIELLKSKDSKVQEAALSALAAIAKDTPSVVFILRRVPPESDAFATVITLTRSRNIDVQLAACLCATHIIRASPLPPLGPYGSPPTYDGSPVLTIVHVLNHLIGSSSASAPAQTKACFILAALARDEREIEKIAVDFGSLDKVAALMVDTTPKETSGWDEDEPEAIARLREAALMATATLTLHWDGIRRDLSSQPFFPCVRLCMSHPNLGVRYAACQCARALCRSVSVLRTSVVDSGLGTTLFSIIKNPEEDHRVQVAALAGICNVLNDFSPMRVVLLEQGAISTIVQLVHSEDKALRLNALWAIKNALFNAASREKRMIMNELSWDLLAALLLDYDEDLREQAVNIVRNLATGEENEADTVFEGLGTDRLAVCIESALISPNDSIVTQGLLATANLSNGLYDNLTSLLSRPRLLEAIRSALHHAKVEVRRAAAACVLKLAQRKIRELREAGIEATLRNMTGGPTTLSGSSELQMGHETDRDTADRVKKALAIIEAARGKGLD